MTLAERLAAVEQRYVRLAPAAAWRAVAGGALLVDTRPSEQRRRDGEVPGSVVVGRNVLEWRLDPTSDARMPGGPDLDDPVIILCDHGCSSVLSVGSLLDAGFSRATDVVGGMQAWLAAGLPTVPVGRCIDWTLPRTAPG